MCGFCSFVSDLNSSACSHKFVRCLPLKSRKLAHDVICNMHFCYTSPATATVMSALFMTLQTLTDKMTLPVKYTQIGAVRYQQDSIRKVVSQNGKENMCQKTKLPVAMQCRTSSRICECIIVLSEFVYYAYWGEVLSFQRRDIWCTQFHSSASLCGRRKWLRFSVTNICFPVSLLLKRVRNAYTACRMPVSRTDGPMHSGTVVSEHVNERVMHVETVWSSYNLESDDFKYFPSVWACCVIPRGSVETCRIKNAGVYRNEIWLRWFYFLGACCCCCCDCLLRRSGPVNVFWSVLGCLGRCLASGLGFVV